MSQVSLDMLDKSNQKEQTVYAFGGGIPEEIYKTICEIVGDSEYVTLKRNKTADSIYMFKGLVFSIRINSKTQCLDTKNAIAFEYISEIAGASSTKNTAHIPLLTDNDSLAAIKNMLIDIYEQRRAQVSGDPFGCCNDHVRCSDAGYCLHLKNEDYWGCIYRKNLEAGRIFYGKNKNI